MKKTFILILLVNVVLLVFVTGCKKAPDLKLKDAEKALQMTKEAERKQKETDKKNMWIF